MLKVIQEETPWYAEGLRFECTGCGQCCTGAPGYVWVDEKEIQNIADYLNLSVEEFSQRFLYRVKGRFSLVDLPKTYDCIFSREEMHHLFGPPDAMPHLSLVAAPAKVCKRLAIGGPHLRRDSCPAAPVSPCEIIDQQRAIQEKISPTPLTS